MSSLVEEDYKEPSKTVWFKPDKAGLFRFRMLAPKPIMGNQYFKPWNGGVKPVKIPKDVDIDYNDVPFDSNGEQSVNFFWMLLGWSYYDQRCGVLTITQKLIRKQLMAYDNKPEWGSPVGYDFEIEGTTEKGITKYNLTVMPKSPIAPEVAIAWSNFRFDESKIWTGNGTGDDPVWTGGNPFYPEAPLACEEYGAWQQEEAPKPTNSAVHGKTETTKAEAKKDKECTSEQVDTIIELSLEAGIKGEARIAYIKQAYKVERVVDLTDVQAKDLIEKLAIKIAKNKAAEPSEDVGADQAAENAQEAAAANLPGEQFEDPFAATN